MKLNKQFLVFRKWVIKMGAYYQDGDLIDYTPNSAVAAGDVVQIGKLVTVAPRPIAAAAHSGSMAACRALPVASANDTPAACRRAGRAAAS
jgi:predicted RecA/RadA family phage recombinase